MGRRPCCEKEGLNRGAWTAIEDKILTDYIQIHGEGKWRHLPKRAGLKRCGKSCRLRWLNYLTPDIKRGNITPEEEDLIIRLHKLLGNRWSLIAGRLPGRTDNEIKNYWNTYIGKKFRKGKSKSMATSSGAEPSSSSLAGQDCDPDQDQDLNPLPNTGSSPCLIRTEASRCTKVILSKEFQPSMAEPSLAHDHHEEREAPPPFVDWEGNTNSLLDFMANFEIDESIFSDLLNMDIPEASYFENNNTNKIVEDNNASTSEQGCNKSSPPVSNDLCLNISDNSLYGFEDFNQCQL